MLKEGKLLKLEAPTNTAQDFGYKQGDLVIVTGIKNNGFSSLLVSYKSLCDTNLRVSTISVKGNDNFVGVSGTKRFKEAWE